MSALPADEPTRLAIEYPCESRVRDRNGNLTRCRDTAAARTILTADCGYSRTRDLCLNCLARVAAGHAGCHDHDHTIWIVAHEVIK